MLISFWCLVSQILNHTESILTIFSNLQFFQQNLNIFFWLIYHSNEKSNLGAQFFTYMSLEGSRKHVKTRGPSWFSGSPTGLSHQPHSDFRRNTATRGPPFPIRGSCTGGAATSKTPTGSAQHADVRTSWSREMVESFPWSVQKWRFPEMVVPPDHPFIIIYRWIFHEINHPAIGVPCMETAMKPVPKKMERLPPDSTCGYLCFGDQVRPVGAVCWCCRLPRWAAFFFGSTGSCGRARIHPMTSHLMMLPSYQATSKYWVQ